MIDRPGWYLELWGEVVGFWIYFDGIARRICQWIRSGKSVRESEGGRSYG